LSRTRFHISTDASGKKGIGGVHFEEMSMFSTQLKCRHHKKHINWKEMFAILYAFASWSEHWTNGRVIVSSDNKAVADGLNKRTIRDAAKLALLGVRKAPRRLVIYIAVMYVTARSHKLDRLVSLQNLLVFKFLQQG
jgi:hypothetical protein